MGGDSLRWAMMHPGGFWIAAFFYSRLGGSDVVAADFRVVADEDVPVSECGSGPNQGAVADLVGWGDEPGAGDFGVALWRELGGDEFAVIVVNEGVTRRWVVEGEGG